MGECLMFRKGIRYAAPFIPAWYTELEYIESSGTQYIDTGFKPNQDTRVVLDAELTAVSASTHAALFGARNSDTGQFWWYWRYNDSRFAFRYGSGTTNGLAGDTALTKHVFDVNKNVFSVSGESVTVASATFDCAYTAYLLAANNAGAALYPCSCKLYSCQIYDNGTLVRDFVPVLNSNGEAGLFDRVGLKFYGNAGSGVFIAGGDING